VKAQIGKLREGDGAKLYTKLAVEEIVSRPAKFLELSIGKAANFWRLYPNPVVRSVSNSQKLVGILSYGPVLILAIVWFLRNRRRWAVESLLFIYPIAAMLVAAATVSVDRYRLPFDLYLIILAAAAIDWWVSSTTRKKQSTPAERVQQH